MQLFGICLHRVVVVLLFRGEMVAVAVFEESYVGILAVHISCDTLQTAEQQCLTHDTEIGTQRIHQFDGGLLCVAV